MADQKILGMCPCCGSNIVESPKAYGCENRDCKAVIFKENKYFQSIGLPVTEEVAEQLFNDGKYYAEGLISKRTGKAYNAYIKAEFNDGSWPSFSMEFPS